VSLTSVRVCLGAFAAFALMFGCALRATGSTQVAPTVTIRNGHLALDGAPYLPIMDYVGSACPERAWIDKFAAFGVNLVTEQNGDCSSGGGLPSPAVQLDTALSGHDPPIWFYDQSQAGRQLLAGAQTLLNWQAPPLRFLYASQTWMLDACKGQSTLPFYSSVAKQVARGALVAVYIEVGSIPSGSSYSHFNCITARRMTVAAYTAIVAGASAIEYITIDPRDANYGGGFNVSQRAGDAAAALSRELTRYAPILLAQPVTSSSSNSNVKLAVYRYAGRAYAIVVNTQNTTESTTLTTTRGINGRARVLKGTTGIVLRGGEANDTLPPLAVQIFELP
jgi:hypothetical protein